MTDTLFEIVHEDDELLVINKPADLVCHPTKGNEMSSLISRVRLHLGQAAAHMINRLDRETTGIVLLAKRDESAVELRRLWESGGAQKSYNAIVHGHVEQDSGTIDEPLGCDEASPVAIKNCVRADGNRSQTGFTVADRLERKEGLFSLLRVRPRTGRKHQIRIHLSHIGHPIVGDKLYGHDEDCYLALVEGRLTSEQRRALLLPCHALHACKLMFKWHDKEWRFEAKPDARFSDFLAGRPPSAG